MITVLNSKPERYMHFYTGSGGLTKGALAVLDTGTAIEASEGVATAILLGVAMEDYSAGEICSIYPLTGTELEIDIYQGSTTDTFAAANVGTPFDVLVASHDYSLDANDISGAFLVLMSYDNTAQKATVRALNSVIYCG